MDGLTNQPRRAKGDTRRPPPEVWADVLKTLADPMRLRMVRLLELQAHHGLSVGELAEIFKLPQSTVSRHIKLLTEAGLAVVRRDGTSMLYRLSDMANANDVKQLRALSRQQIDATAQARTDDQRLRIILKQRADAAGNAEHFYGKTAPHWDQIREAWFGATFHLEAMLALLNPAWTVADLGTGTGAMLPLLAAHVREVIAVDPSTPMLRAAQLRVREAELANVFLRQGSLEDLPIKPATVDVALLSLVLHHVVYPGQALKEVARILKPGGAALIVDLQPHEVKLFGEQMHHRWMGFGQEQLEQWAREAGLGKVRWHPLPAKQGRVKDVVVPDLFVMRAEKSE